MTAVLISVYVGVVTFAAIVLGVACVRLLRAYAGLVEAHRVRQTPRP